MRIKKVLIICMAIFMAAVVAYAGAIKIEPASEAQRNLVQMALGDQYPILKIFAVKSGNHRRAYYVGAVFHARGAGNTTGIWLVIGKTKDAPAGLVLSVDGGAYHFSGMRRASKTKAYAHSTDPEAKVLSRYLSKWCR